MNVLKLSERDSRKSPFAEDSQLATLSLAPAHMMCMSRMEKFPYKGLPLSLTGLLSKPIKIKERGEGKNCRYLAVLRKQHPVDAKPPGY